MSFGRRAWKLPPRRVRHLLVTSGQRRGLDHPLVQPTRLPSCCTLALPPPAALTTGAIAAWLVVAVAGNVKPTRP